MRKLVISVVLALVVLGATSTVAADVRLTIQGGRVTLLATHATVREILAEWARVGQTKIINGERIQGGPVTLELTDVPERQALDVLLRTVSGYLAAPRATIVANTSVFDRIIVMPTNVAAAPPPVAGSPPPTFAQPAQPAFVPPAPVPLPFDDRDDDQPSPAGDSPQNRGPVFVFPPAQGTNPQQGAPFNQGVPGVGQPQQAIPLPGGRAVLPPAVSYPGAPTAATPSGVAVPGMIVPVPQSGQPVIVVPAQPQRER